MIQAGYYTLKTLEGIKNGYVCLTYMGSQLEVRIRIDKATGDKVEYKGHFTRSFATLPQDPCAVTLTAGMKGTACLGTGAIDTQSLPDTRDGIDFTLFCQNRPCMIAQILLPEPIPEPEVTPETESEPAPESEPMSESEPMPESEPEQEYDPEPMPEADQTETTYQLQEFDPFNTTNNAYHWWICTNTEDFYQLMEDSGIVPDPPLYTALSSALGRFGHFLFGQYQESESIDNRILLIFGVPVSGSTPVPAQNNARWIPAHNKFAGNSNYAGYWLYYFDAKTKCAVRAKLRE